MVVYLVSKFTDWGYPDGWDIDLLFVASNLDKALRFIKESLDDPNSGIEHGSLIQIDAKEVDAVSLGKHIGRMFARNWGDKPIGGGRCFENS